ncbi:hypothetical protein BH23ACT11_BH23ACT11_24840 [soil metagenome]
MHVLNLCLPFPCWLRTSYDVSKMLRQRSTLGGWLDQMFTARLLSRSVESPSKYGANMSHFTEAFLICRVARTRYRIIARTEASLWN